MVGYVNPVDILTEREEEETSYSVAKWFLSWRVAFSRLMLTPWLTMVTSSNVALSIWRGEYCYKNAPASVATFILKSFYKLPSSTAQQLWVLRNPSLRIELPWSYGITLPWSYLGPKEIVFLTPIGFCNHLVTIAFADMVCVWERENKTSSGSRGTLYHSEEGSSCGLALYALRTLDYFYPIPISRK